MKALRLVLLSVAAVLVLWACVPQAGVNTALCALGQQGDEATLVLTDDSWIFTNPTDEVAANVVGYGGGTDIATESPSGEDFANGIAWFLDENGGLDVQPNQEVEVTFTGTDRSISVTYNREGQVEPLYCRVRE